MLTSFRERIKRIFETNKSLNDFNDFDKNNFHDIEVFDNKINSKLRKRLKNLMIKY